MKKFKKQIAPSVMCADFMNLGKCIKDFEDKIALKVLSLEYYSRCQSGPEVITKVLIRRRQDV